MNLAELQGAYRVYLLEGNPAALAESVVADAFAAEEKLGIYRNNFLISLGEALSSNFPVTRQLLGADFFAQAARGFILASPPDKPCLFEYGAGFAQYLAGLGEMAGLPYVPEMARFEYARIEAYNAPVEKLLTEVELARVAPEALTDLPLRLAAHVRLLRLDYPIGALWQAHQSVTPELGGIEMKAEPRPVLVCRPQRSLVMQQVDDITACFLEAASRPTTLAAAAGACGPDLSPDRLGQVISLALQLRLLVSRR
jgi:hypothetical protein